MNLPMNGGVVVIDDNMREALPLLKQLSKEGISYSYYDGTPHDYPENPLDSVRIVFTDMQLDESSYGGNKSSKNVLGSLISGLNALIGKDNGPYIIFVWSKNEAQYLLDFKKMINEENALECKPLDIISMEKAECFVTKHIKDIIKIYSFFKKYFVTKYNVIVIHKRAYSSVTFPNSFPKNDNPLIFNAI